MRLKIKILLLIAIFLVSFNGSCLKKLFGGGDPCTNVCCSSCIPDQRYSIIYTDGCSRDLQGVYCTAGTLKFPRDCNGGCSAYVRPEQHFFFSFTASPSSADLNNPPASATVTGQAMDATYGMPRVDYYNEDGYLIGTTYATSVAGDGSSLVAPVPDLSQSWSGTYTLEVVNKNSEGFYVDFLGSATVSCWGRDRPDTDGDGWYDDEDCYPFNASLWDCSGVGDGGGDCGGGGGENLMSRPCYDQY
jgi:hypothetical protein